MIWNDGVGWHTVVWLGMALFWLLVIMLALVPTKYLLAQANLPDLCDRKDDSADADAPPPSGAGPGATPREG